MDATDDAICLKSHSADAVCQNIEVRNNTACSSASGVKFGTASTGGFKNIKIINNTIFDTFRSAITIQAVDGGLVENIVVDSLRSINTGNPIYLVVGERREGRRSRMDNVHISNVYAEVPATKPDELDKVPEMPKAYPEFSQHKELPAWGFYVRHVDGVTFKNVKLTALKKDYRPAIVLDDVHNGAFTKIKVVEPSAGKKEKIHVYKSTKIKK